MTIMRHGTVALGLALFIEAYLKKHRTHPFLEESDHTGGPGLRQSTIRSMMFHGWLMSYAMKYASSMITFSMARDIRSSIP